MDNIDLIRIVAGACCIALLFILIQRRRKRIQ